MKETTLGTSRHPFYSNMHESEHHETKSTSINQFKRIKFNDHNTHQNLHIQKNLIAADADIMHSSILLPPWLSSAKEQIKNSKPVQLLRKRALFELKSRLNILNRLHPSGLSSMSLKDREELIKEVADKIRRESSYTNNSNNDRVVTTRDVWRDARTEIERVLDEKLSIAIMAGVISGDIAKSASPGTDIKVR